MPSYFNKKQAICIDDDPHARYLLKKLLKDNGFVVFEASDGEKGLNILQKNIGIEFVFIDLKMPVLDGYSFLRIINNDVHYANLKIVVIATCTAEEFIQASEMKGVKTNQIIFIVEKPIDLKKMAQVMKLV